MEIIEISKDKNTAETTGSERKSSDSPVKRLLRTIGRAGTSVKRLATRYAMVLLGVIVLLVIGIAGYGMWELSFQPGFCNGCHIIRPYVTSYQSSDNLDNVHQQANVVCKDCHHVSPVEALREVGVYIAGDYREPLPETEMAQESCLECHRSYSSLIERTSHLEPNPHDSHFGELECSMCHKSHSESALFCQECHTWELEPL
ncbi:MAG: cytochrome c3 family protein [Anaerolineales bacterium]|nr:cytochrome c3 family protein [Anaerolineales bacterium]